MLSPDLHLVSLEKSSALANLQSSRKYPGAPTVKIAVNFAKGFCTATTGPLLPYFYRIEIIRNHESCLSTFRVPQLVSNPGA